jgi:hypothetical protein
MADGGAEASVGTGATQERGIEGATWWEITRGRVRGK